MKFWVIINKKIKESNNMLETVKHLPFFDRYDNNDLEELLNIVLKNHNINEEIIEIIKTKNPLKLNGVFLKENIKISVVLKKTKKYDLNN